MNYRLMKKSENRLKTTFHVLNGKGDVIGSINVPPQEASDLLRHWRGAIDQPARASVPAPMLGIRPFRFSRQAALRG
jgi:hypothetical protein